jgi:sugar phosphate isomerase/epimerase
MLLETHDSFSHPECCQKLNEILREPLGILWDSHHTWKISGESPEETWSKLGSWVKHIHYKDSIEEDALLHYVLPGTGEFPTTSLLRLLQGKGYDGGFSLEWEKLWHPELPPLRNALEKFRTILNIDSSK